MNNFPSRTSSRIRRPAAFFIALLCLWMATVGVVCHTDDLHLHGSSTTKVVLHNGLVADATPDVCAACQWLACVQTAPQAPASLTTPYVFQACSYTKSNPAPVRRFSTLHGSRAPPTPSHLPPRPVSA